MEAQAWPIGVLRQLSALADHFFFDKVGKTKDPHKIVEEMLAANLYRKELISQQLEATVGQPTPEQVLEAYTKELLYDEVAECYKKWAVNFFETKLTHSQRKDRKFGLKFDGDGAVRLSNSQRSFIDNMLRKSVASKHVGFTIWQIGLPPFLENPPAYLQDPSSHERLLQSGAEEMVKWLERLGAELHRRCGTAGYLEQKRLSGSSYKSSGRSDEDHDRKRQLEGLKEQRAKAKRLCVELSVY